MEIIATKTFNPEADLAQKNIKWCNYSKITEGVKGWSSPIRRNIVGGVKSYNSDLEDRTTLTLNNGHHLGI